MTAISSCYGGVSDTLDGQRHSRGMQSQKTCLLNSIQYDDRLSSACFEDFQDFQRFWTFTEQGLGVPADIFCHPQMLVSTASLGNKHNYGSWKRTPLWRGRVKGDQSGDIVFEAVPKSQLQSGKNIEL